MHKPMHGQCMLLAGVTAAAAAPTASRTAGCCPWVGVRRAACLEGAPPIGAPLLECDVVLTATKRSLLRKVYRHDRKLQNHDIRMTQKKQHIPK